MKGSPVGMSASGTEIMCRKSTDGRATFSVTNRVGWGADTRSTIFNKSVRTAEVADVSGGAHRRSMVRVSALGTAVLDLEQLP